MCVLPCLLLAPPPPPALNSSCSHNQLQSLPPSLPKLPKLSTLIASYNPDLQTLPAKLSSLTGLSDLQMAHCSLKAVPQALAAAPKLKLLQLEGNPFDDKKLPKVCVWVGGGGADPGVRKMVGVEVR